MPEYFNKNHDGPIINMTTVRKLLYLTGMTRIKKTNKVEGNQRSGRMYEKKPQVPHNEPSKSTTVVKKFQMKPLHAKTGSGQSGAKGEKKKQRGNGEGLLV